MHHNFNWLYLKVITELLKRICLLYLFTKLKGKCDEIMFDFFCEESIGLIVIGTFYLKYEQRAAFLSTLFKSSRSYVFKTQQNLNFFQENQRFKNKVTDFANHC